MLLIGVLTGVIKFFDLLRKATMAAGVVIPDSILTDGVIALALVICVLTFTAKGNGTYVDGQLVRHAAKAVALGFVVLAIRQSRIVLDEARPLPASFYGFLAETGSNAPVDQGTVRLKDHEGREVHTRVMTSDETGLYGVTLVQGTAARRWTHLEAFVGGSPCEPSRLSLRRSDQLPEGDARWSTIRNQVGRRLRADEVFVHYVRCGASP